MHVTYPSVEQFRNIVREVTKLASYRGEDENGPIYDFNSEMPKLRFQGTVKINGASSALTRLPDGTVISQSKKQTTPGAQGFQLFAEENAKCFGEIFESFEAKERTVTLFGQWAGKGIQKGVAAAFVAPFFSLFAAKIGEEWFDDITRLPTFPERRIFNVHQFGIFEMDIDFSDPSSIQDKLEELTLKVKNRCPVGDFFGVDGPGEGVIWSAKYKDKIFRFEIKGSSQVVSKENDPPVDPEKLDSITRFVEYAVTEKRLEQGLSALRDYGLEVSEKTAGEFIGWVVRNIKKEESDTLESRNLTLKEVGKAVTAAARNWYLSKTVDVPK